MELNYLEDYWPSADGLSAVNVIGRKLRDPINSGLRRERGQGNIHSLCPADREQVWQSYPVDPYSDGFTYISYCAWTYSSTGTLFKEKIRTRLDLLGIPQSGGKTVKTFRWDHRLQIQKPLHGI